MTGLRAATLADVAAIMGIETEAFGLDAWSVETMSADVERPDSRYLVAIDAAGTVIGYAGVAVVPSAREADVQTVAVDRSARGRGTGRALLRGVLAEARRAGAREVFLEVRDGNAPAWGLYLSEGFREIGRRRRYYRGGEDAIVMRKGLTESVGAVGAEVVGGEPLIVGIESSCDETGVGIVRGTTLLANVIASSMEEHARYGGVVPEIAARAHLEAFRPTLAEALETSGVRLGDVDAVAVTAGPGLAGALMVGVGAAKGLAVALGKPLYGVNHLVGHVGADILDRGQLDLPTIALLVSGGHTSLLLVRDIVDDIRLLGETIDDAAGEAFDKVARLLGLRYPGGPNIQAAAEGADARGLRFPRGLTRPKDLERHRYDYSFSGLKTAVARHVESVRARGAEVDVPQVAKAFQDAVVDVLLGKALAACRDSGVPRLLLGGGVVANSALRAEAERRCAEEGVELHIPALSLCTDNGAMIAALGAQLVAAGKPPSGLGFGVDSTLPVVHPMVLPA